MSSVYEIYNYIDEIAPFSSQLDWDNSGFLIKSELDIVKKVLVTLDITADVVSEALKGSFDLIVSHHPVIFNSLRELNTDDISYMCVKNNIAVISAHTNFDIANNGVSKILAEKLLLKDIFSDECNLIRIGTLSKEMTDLQFADFVKKHFNTNIKFNNVSNKIKKVAVSGGAGSDFWHLAKNLGADVLLTGEVKYHEFIDAAACNFMLVSAGHYETEFPAVIKLCHMLSAKFKDVEFKTANQKSPIINL